MKKSIYVVTHGNKHNGANPGMSEEGFAQIIELKPLLPSNPTLVICGTGKRHMDVQKALNFESVLTCYTASVGGPESLEKINGQDMVILADGTLVARTSYTTTADGIASMLAVLEAAPDNSVICAGRPSLIMLGKADAKSAAVYLIHFFYEEGYGLPLNCGHLQIHEVRATGISEAGAV